MIAITTNNSMSVNPRRHRSEEEDFMGLSKKRRIKKPSRRHAAAGDKT